MTLASYPSYKDSGVGWLGRVPEHWDVCALKRLVRMQSGASITAADICSEGEYPVFGGNGVRGYSSGFTHDGDFVLIGRQGALCGNVNYASGRFWASEHAVVVTPIADVNWIWLGEVLRTMNLNQYSLAAAQPGLSVDLIARLALSVPSRGEQDEIAAFLKHETAKIDSLIAEQQKLIELLREKRQSVISYTVTKGLNPDAPMKPSMIEWIGDVPEHWEVTRLGNLFHEVAEPGTDGLPILTVSIHRGVSDSEVPEEESDRKVTRSEDRSKYLRVEPGDLVYNMMRAWQGGFGTVKVRGLVSPAYVVARPRRKLSTMFVEHLLRTPNAIEQMRRYSKGVTDFRLRLYWDEFKSIMVAAPPCEEAIDICTRIDSLDKESKEMRLEGERMIELLRERRAAIISAAVTGQIDVRSADASTAA